MSSLMGDATHDNVPALEQAGPWPLVAGYVTGTPDIQWTAADWASFPGSVLVTIDQGATGSPVATAVVRDYEPGAWYTSAVVSDPWSAPRPTIYCDQSDLPTVLSYGWQGCLWLAIVGWQSGDALPSAPGCEIVAVQNAQNVSGAYDTSIVLDPYWPNQGGSMPLVIWGASGNAYLLDGGKLHHVQDTTSLDLYTAAGVQQAGSAGGTHVTAAEEAQLLVDFPPGSPAVTVPPVTVTIPTLTTTGTITPEASS